MGLLSTIQKAVNSGFNALDDLAPGCTYQVNNTAADSSDTFNPTTGVVTEDFTSHTNIKMVPTVVAQKYIDNGLAQVSDRAYLMNGYGISFTPSAGDRITVSSKDWDVYHVDTDPANATYTLLVRGGE